MFDSDSDVETMAWRFNRLLNELQRGTMNRNAFQRWEVMLLLDIESYPLSDATKRRMLRRYQRAMMRRLESGSPTPVMFSEYMNWLRVAREQSREHATTVTQAAALPA